MPHWLIITLIVFLVAPGAVIILFGVYALFRAAEPQAPAPEPEPPATAPATSAMNFSSLPLTIDTVDAPAPMDDDFVPAADPDAVIDAEIESPASAPMVPPAAADDSDVT